MIPQLENNRQTIATLCRRYPIERLAVFGSAVRGDFVPGQSDIDFLVHIKPCDPAQYADVYFSLYADLERLFSDPIDLVTEPSVTNPYVLRNIKAVEQEIYADA